MSGINPNDPGLTLSKDQSYGYYANDPTTFYGIGSQGGQRTGGSLLSPGSPAYNTALASYNNQTKGTALPDTYTPNPQGTSPVSPNTVGGAPAPTNIGGSAAATAAYNGQSQALQGAGNAGNAPTSGSTGYQPPAQAGSADQYLQNYLNSLQPSAEVNDVQNQLANLQQSQYLSHKDLEGQAIATHFVTGQEAAVDKGLNQQQQTLTQRLATAQQRQQSAMDVNKAALDYYSGKDRSAADAAQHTADQNFTAQQNELNRSATKTNSEADNAAALARAQQSQNAPQIVGTANTGYYSVANGVASPLSQPVTEQNKVLPGGTTVLSAADYQMKPGETVAQYNARIAAAQSQGPQQQSGGISPLSQPQGSTAQPTASIQEYNFAKGQGYKGTFDQYQKEQANLKNPSPTSGQSTLQKDTEYKANLWLQQQPGFTSADLQKFNSDPQFKAWAIGQSQGGLF